MTQLTEHFSWEEACVTSVRNIDNTIPEDIKPAIQKTAVRLESSRVTWCWCDCQLLVSFARS